MLASKTLFSPKQKLIERTRKYDEEIKAHPDRQETLVNVSS